VVPRQTIFPGRPAIPRANLVKETSAASRAPSVFRPAVLARPSRWAAPRWWSCGPSRASPEAP